MHTDAEAGRRSVYLLSESVRLTTAEWMLRNLQRLARAPPGPLQARQTRTRGSVPAGSAQRRPGCTGGGPFLSSGILRVLAWRATGPQVRSPALPVRGRARRATRAASASPAALSPGRGARAARAGSQAAIPSPANAAGSRPSGAVKVAGSERLQRQGSCARPAPCDLEPAHRGIGPRSA